MEAKGKIDQIITNQYKAIVNVNNRFFIEFKESNILRVIAY